MFFVVNTYSALGGDNGVKKEETKRALISSAIRVIARDGLDKTTTRSIATDANLNEVYIYRIFENKDELLCEMFDMLDDELVTEVLARFPVMNINGMDFESKARILFFFCWKFMLGNSDKCISFIRYYYSPYFKKYSYDEHIRRYQGVIEKISPAFCENSNVWMLFNHVLSTMLNFAVKVFNGDIGDNDDTSEHVFRVVYFSINQYLKPEKVG